MKQRRRAGRRPARHEPQITNLYRPGAVAGRAGLLSLHRLVEGVSRVKRKTIISGAAAVVIGVSMAGCTFEDSEERGLDDDAAAMLTANVTLADAIATAEKEAGGKAISAGIDDEDDAFFIAVTVALGEQVRTVLIDPQSGRVVKIGAHDEDGEDDEDDEEDDE